MASNSRVITLDSLTAQQPTLRLRLERAAGELQDKKPNDPGYIAITTSWVKNMFSHQNIKVDLEEGGG